MLAYLKLKTNDDELCESDYLSKLQNKTSIFSKIQYKICYIYYQLFIWIKYCTNTITVKEIYGGYIFIFPFSNVNNKKINSCMKKVKQLIQKYKIKSVVLTEELNNYQGFKNKIQQVNIVDGKGIMPYLIKEIIEHIVNLQKENLEEQTIYICVNESKDIYIDNILFLIHYFKSVNIITNKINTYQKIADKIAQKENIIITVTNNKKKSLRKAKIIVNFDFENSEMSKYNIYRNAILISVKEQEAYENIGFDGIQIRQIGIDISEKTKELFEKYNLMETCNLATLYESLINEKQRFIEIKEKMQEDEVRIIKLYGKNGEIFY